MIAGVPVVGIDDAAAARTAAEHRLSPGHESVAAASFAPLADVRGGRADPVRREQAACRVRRLRLRGYRAASDEGDAGLAEPDVAQRPPVTYEYNRTG